MKDFAFYLTPFELSYYEPIIRNLPTDFFDIHIGSSQHRQCSFANLSNEIKKEIKTIADYGYSIFSLNSTLVNRYQKLIMSSGFFSRSQKLFDWNTTKASDITCLFHSVDIPARSNEYVARSYLCAHQRQAETKETNKILQRENPALFMELMNLPQEMINEFAYAGPYHFGEWAIKRHLPKDHLRVELEDKLQVNLPSYKPIVAFLQDEFCHPGQLVQALKQLAQHVTLIIKPLGQLEPIAGTYIWPDESYAPNLLRFAADFILAGYHSGSLASASMLGLKVIPYYTNLIHFGGRNFGRLSKYTAYLPGYFKGEHVCVDILRYLNPPIDLMNTKFVLDRIYDMSWWTGYTQRLSAAQKVIFGDYDIDGAAAKAARLLIRAFGRRSFGKDVVAVRLRPEYD